MQNIHKIAVIGGTGKSGKYLVQQLLQQGFPIKMLCRNPETFSNQHPLIKVVPGSVRDYDTVHGLIEGCQAVISTLGQPKGETPVFSQATTNVLLAMGVCGLRRYIVTTGLNVDTPFDKKGTATSAGTEWMKAHYPLTTADKQRESELLLESDIDWTLVRLPLIELMDTRNEVRVSLEDCPGEKIGVRDLADFLIEQLFEEAYIRKAPFIANV